MYKILIIDDNGTDRALLARTIESHIKGCQIMSTGSAQEGLEEINKNPPDLVFLDIYLSDKRGMDVLKEIRTGKHKDIPIILVSTFVNLLDKKTCLDLGADDIINKPIVPQDVKFRIDVQLKLKKIRADAAWVAQKTNEGIRLLYKDLEQKNKELQRLDGLKSDFVSVVSHELRTPLAISIEGINLILDGIVGDVPDKQKHLLTTSHDNLIRLNTIINDLLDIQKIEAGKVVLKQGLVDLKGFILKLAEDYQKVLAKRKQILNVKLPAGELFLYVDGDKIIQVMTNLLNNAHKFTPEGGAIEVEIIEQDEDFLCRVKDTGIGLSKENTAKLFQKFQQFGRTEGAGPKGTGLGLAISKALIELHGGKIWAESQINQGTAFNFTLPKYDCLRKKFDHQIDKTISEANSKGDNVLFIVLRLANAQIIAQKYGPDFLMKTMNAVFASFSDVLTRPKDICMLYDIHTVYFVLPKTDKAGGKVVIGKLKEAIHNCRLDIKDKSELEFQFGCAFFPQEAGTREGLIRQAFHEATRKKTVLVVDDHQQIFQMLEARLNTLNMQTQGVTDGEDALFKISKNIPDLIILDIMMPRMNGYEFWGKLKEDARTADIPVIILTAKSVDDVLGDYKGLGSVPIVNKTDGFAHIVSLIQKILS